MAFGIPFAFVIDSLFDEADVSAPYGCRSTASAGGRSRSQCAVRKTRSTCGPSRRHPYCSRQARCSPGIGRHDELRALDDSYVLFVDIPGYSKEQVTVKVDDGFLIVSTVDESPAQEECPAKAVLMERRRGGLHQRWKLPEDALLNGIHAKLQNGELVIVIPKSTEKVPKHFVVPVLGADGATDSPSATQLDASAQEALADPPLTAVAQLAAPAEPASDTLMGPEVEPAVHAELAAHAPAPADAAAAPMIAEASAELAAADVPTAPAPVKASAPLAAAVASADAAMPDAKEDDGSWTDVSDEEREALQAFVRAKGKAPMEGPVLEEIERQEAQRTAQMQHDADSD